MIKIGHKISAYQGFSSSAAVQFAARLFWIRRPPIWLSVFGTIRRQAGTHISFSKPLNHCPHAPKNRPRICSLLDESPHSRSEFCPAGWAPGTAVA